MTSIFVVNDVDFVVNDTDLVVNEKEFVANEFDLFKRRSQTMQLIFSE